MIERMAMHSEPTAIPNLDCMVKPSKRPPIPIIIFLKVWAQKSITQPISTRVGLMSSLRIPVSLFSCSSLCKFDFIQLLSEYCLVVVDEKPRWKVRWEFLSSIKFSALNIKLEWIILPLPTAPNIPCFKINFGYSPLLKIKQSHPGCLTPASAYISEILSTDLYLSWIDRLLTIIASCPSLIYSNIVL